MPADTLAELFQFEAQIETAAVAMLTAALADPTVAVVQERNAAQLKTPRIEVKLQMGVPTGHRKALVGSVRNPQQTLPDAFNAQLVLTTLTNRNTANNGSRHDDLVGKVRVAMLVALGTLNAELIWLNVVSINSAGVVPIARVDSDLDTSPEIFNLVFSICADAWPALPGAV